MYTPYLKLKQLLVAMPEAKRNETLEKLKHYEDVKVQELAKNWNQHDMEQEVIGAALRSL